MTNRQETKAVKEALRAVGINALVSHPRGGCWDPLEVNIGSGKQWGDARLVNLQVMGCQVRQIAQQVVDREVGSKYEARVVHYDPWDEAKQEATPIRHPDWHRD